MSKGVNPSIMHAHPGWPPEHPGIVRASTLPLSAAQCPPAGNPSSLPPGDLGMVVAGMSFPGISPAFLGTCLPFPYLSLAINYFRLLSQLCCSCSLANGPQRGNPQQPQRRSSWEARTVVNADLSGHRDEEAGRMGTNPLSRKNPEPRFPETLPRANVRVWVVRLGLGGPIIGSRSMRNPQVFPRAKVRSHLWRWAASLWVPAELQSSTPLEYLRGQPLGQIGWRQG